MQNGTGEQMVRGFFLKTVSLGNLITIGTILAGIAIAWGRTESKLATVPTPAERKAEIRDEIQSADSTLLYRLGQVENSVNAMNTKIDVTNTKVDSLKEAVDFQGGKLDRKLNRILEAH